MGPMSAVKSEHLPPAIAEAWAAIPEDLRYGVTLRLSRKRAGAYYSPFPHRRGIYISPAFETYEPSIIHGVLLHELGHARQNNGGFSPGAGMVLTLSLAAALLAVYNCLTLTFESLPGHSLLTLIVLALASVNQWGLSPIFLKTRRQQELDADLFSVRHGGGAGMYQHLSKNGVIVPEPVDRARRTSTHPSSAYRLHCILEASKEAAGASA